MGHHTHRRGHVQRGEREDMKATGKSLWDISEKRVCTYDENSGICETCSCGNYTTDIRMNLVMIKL